jgi:hypothetical protein
MLFTVVFRVAKRKMLQGTSTRYKIRLKNSNREFSLRTTHGFELMDLRQM